MADSFVLLRCRGIFLCDCARATLYISLIKHAETGTLTIIPVLSLEQTWAEGESRSVCGCQVRLSPQTWHAQTLDIRRPRDVFSLGGSRADVLVSASLCVCTNSWQKRKTKGWRPLGGNSQPSPYGMSSAHQSRPRLLPPPSRPASLFKSDIAAASTSFLSGSTPGRSRPWVPRLTCSCLCVSVSGERPFQCRYCPYSASQKGNLKTHVQTVHRLAFDNAQYPDRRLRQAPTNDPADPSSHGSPHWAITPLPTPPVISTESWKLLSPSKDGVVHEHARMCLQKPTPRLINCISCRWRRICWVVFLV